MNYSNKTIFSNEEINYIRGVDCPSKRKIRRKILDKIESNIRDIEIIFKLLDEEVISSNLLKLDATRLNSIKNSYARKFPSMLYESAKPANFKNEESMGFDKFQSKKLDEIFDKIFIKPRRGIIVFQKKNNQVKLNFAAFVMRKINIIDGSTKEDILLSAEKLLKNRKREIVKNKVKLCLDLFGREDLVKIDKNRINLTDEGKYIWIKLASTDPRKYRDLLRV